MKRKRTTVTVEVETKSVLLLVHNTAAHWRFLFHAAPWGFYE